MKLVQVFDAGTMDAGLSEDFQTRNECSNDSYVRWYPSDNESDALCRQVHSWLVSQGMVVTDPGEYFYVLIHVSW